jgi:Phosphate-starvation-inducible E family
MAQPRLRFHFSEYVGKGEVIVYSVLAILLLVTALATATIAGKMLWDGLAQRSAEFQILQVLDELLVVLMLVEVLHTVRISIRSHILVTEPFLVIGLIASIRRMLVITLEAANLTQGGAWTTQGQSVFRASMMELALLGFLVLILVFSITLLRRYPAPPDEIEHM